MGLAFAQTAAGRARSGFGRLREAATFGTLISPGLFLGELGVSLIDGRVPRTPGADLRIGFAVITATVVLLFGAVLAAKEQPLKGLSAWKALALVGAAFGTSFLSGVLIRGETGWAVWGGVLAGALTFAAGLGLALREDLRDISIGQAK